MAAFVCFMNILVAVFGLVFAAEIITLLAGCALWALRWKRGRRF